MECIGNTKKIICVTIFVMILLVSFIGITYSFEYSSNESLTFELIGDSTIEIGLNEEYIEYGIKVLKNGVDISDSVKIDLSMVNFDEVGEYKVKYEIANDGNIEYVYRIIKIVDKDSPVIKLKGEEIVYLILNGSYYEEGFEVFDNKDIDIANRVEIIGKVDSSKVGEYKLEYRVIDSDGNNTSVYRTVMVMEPKVTLADTSGDKVIYSSYDASRYVNTVVENRWIDKGFYLKGYIRNNSNNYKVKLKDKNSGLEYIYDMDSEKESYYYGIIDLSFIPNGEYDMYIVGNNEERLLNKLSGFSRLLRSKVGDRLITFTYDDGDYVGLIIEKFRYEYDIVIDPGHGATDVGASNGIMYEKNMNLIQSMYEKCRYESMGLKVFMSRYDDNSYGTLMGPSTLDELQRRAFTVGYYGAVAKVTYSNHHNASVNANENGFEILVSNDLTVDELIVERNLYDKYSEYYGIDDDKFRIYSRDYDTGRIYNKLNGEIYNYMDYYAMIRIPNQLFNVKTVIFEPIYISNSSDFTWYWTNKKWIDVTEIKIEEYVNYLGGTYDSDNSKCL